MGPKIGGTINDNIHFCIRDLKLCLLVWLIDRPTPMRSDLLCDQSPHDASAGWGPPRALCNDFRAWCGNKGCHKHVATMRGGSIRLLMRGRF